MRPDLPSGTVTLLFTDIEGSTKLLHELGSKAYAEALADHRRTLRAAFTRHGGAEVDTEGDAFFVAFATAPAALQAAADAQDSLASGPIRVRMGIHTGTPHLADEGYVGEDVHKGARIAAAAHGGQVVLSRETRVLLGEAFPLTDLGEHRVKDFTESVWIFQLGSEPFPSLKTISNTNLPKAASSFIGRAREVGEVATLLEGRARLVTLSGPGGSGKTRLAIEVASEFVSAYRNGVFWVGLAALRDCALVLETIARTLGAQDGLAAHIGDREMLLLLDNFEQVIDAAPDLPNLLEACPNLRLLVTSRELLSVRGEVEYSVPPLAEPEGVDLFCERARVDPDALVGELCRRLDNLPLALELAAARTRILSPAQILERLSQSLDLLKGGRDVDARQQTLRATIAWSYDLLTSEEQGLFARLAVFRGGFTLEAAEGVAQADVDGLQSLVDKSLLRHRGDRFWMLETIREYAVERLEASGRADELRRRHAAHFLVLAEEAWPHLTGSPKRWLDDLEQEHDNLRAALDRLEVSGETELALRLAGALYRFWDQRAHLAEGRERIERALAADEVPTAARARALNGAAAMAFRTGDVATARARAEEALGLHRALGGAWGAAYSSMQVASTFVEKDELERALPLYEEAIQTFDALGDEHHALVAMTNLATTCGEAGDLDRFGALYQETLRRARLSGNERVEARSIQGLAFNAFMRGRFGEALALVRQSLRTFRHLGELRDVARDLQVIAWALAATGEAGTALRLLSREQALREEISAGVDSGDDEMRDEAIATIRAHLDEAAFTEAWEQGRRLTLDEAVALAVGSGR